MPRFYMFNPLLSERYGPRQTIVVNGDPTAYLVNNATPPNYIPFSTSGEIGPSASGNRFGAHNTLLVENDVGWRYDAFDLPANSGDLVGYFFRRTIALVDSHGRHLADFQGSKAGSDGGMRSGEAAARGPAFAGAPAAGSGEAPGSVLTYNLCAQASTVMANGAVVGTVDGWSTSPPLYTPSAIRLVRSLEKQEGAIFDGTNRVTVARADGIAGFDLAIDGAAFPIIQDLFLYLFSDAWCLSDQFGTISLAGSLGDSPAGHATAEPQPNPQPKATSHA